MTHANSRTSDHDIEPFILERWSPRAFTGEAMPREDLMRIFEAARWAPSASNAQPWRFVYAMREALAWESFLELLIEGNRVWARNASAIFLIASSRFLPPREGMPPAPSPTHSFDTGAAWALLAIQASRMGYAAHGMAGFDYERAARELGVAGDCQVEAMMVVGRPGDRDALPERLRARETPSGRNPLSAFVFETKFGG